MQRKKIISAVLALALMLCAPVLAEDTDARVAELEAQVKELQQALEEAENTIREYEQQSLVVTFDGGEVTLEEAQRQYEYITSMYQAYGYSISGQEDYIREELLHMLGQDALVNFKAEELGYAELDDEAMASYENEAKLAHENYVTSYITYFTQDGMTEEEAREQTEAYLEEIGYSYDGILKSMLQTHAQQALFDAVTADVEVTEEDLQAAYDEAVAADEAAYAENAYDYESTRSNGGAVYWNPEGYRQVKHVLIRFDDDQAARYKDLKSLADDLESRIEVAKAPETADEETAEDATEAPEAAEAPEAEDTAEAEEEPVDVEELEAQLTETLAQLDALYQELMPKAEEVISRFEEGETFDALIDEYNEDPGMTREPGKTEGYYVSANSQMWDPAFTEGAMSIASVGGISAPVRGSYGIHIIYYLADVPAGAVGFDAVRDAVSEDALNNAKNQAYTDQIAAWADELHLEYHLDRFK